MYHKERQLMQKLLFNGFISWVTNDRTKKERMTLQQPIHLIHAKDTTKEYYEMCRTLVFSWKKIQL